MPDPQTQPDKTIVRQTNGITGVLGTAGVGSSQATTVITMPAWQMVAVRVARMYVQTVLGVLTADGIGMIHLAGPGDLWGHLSNALFIGLAPSTIALLQNVLEFLTKVDVKYPQFRA